ncbi:NAD-dependent epimerase/dehydratase [Serratia symbiotica str. 'Cinara cedri']|nr:NAD-dependent epimerase/dehydratase [Serratia symbiotica str. 'Cinara cedri']
MVMKFLVTGAAGFIGYHVATRLLADGNEVIGLDNLNNYYDVALKISRLHLLIHQSKFQFIKLDLADSTGMASMFAEHKFQRVIHLAAQAGVRFSLENPLSYADSNLIGYLNILEGCRHNKVEHLLYASSSAVYGLNSKLPSSTADFTDHPVSLYAATKKANELMSHSYSYLYGIPSTGLRFFTVYGPWGRPDMALFKFTKAMLAGESIDVYNKGEMYRDFTYIDDVTEVIVRLQALIPKPNSHLIINKKLPTMSSAPYCVYNIGNNTSVKVIEYIRVLEQELGVIANKNMLSIQSGDVMSTHADTDKLYAAIGFKPKTCIQDGVKLFVNWYREFYKISTIE